MTPPPGTDLKAFGQIVDAHEAAVRAYVAVRIDDPFEKIRFTLNQYMLAVSERAVAGDEPRGII